MVVLILRFETIFILGGGGEEGVIFEEIMRINIRNCDEKNCFYGVKSCRGPFLVLKRRNYLDERHLNQAILILS